MKTYTLKKQSWRIKRTGRSSVDDVYKFLIGQEETFPMSDNLFSYHLGLNGDDELNYLEHFRESDIYNDFVQRTIFLKSSKSLTSTLIKRLAETDLSCHRTVYDEDGAIQYFFIVTSTMTIKYNRTHKRNGVPILECVLKTANDARADEIVDAISDLLESKESVVYGRWYYYTTRGHLSYIDILMKEPRGITTKHVPWVPSPDIDSFFREYNDSDSNILILLGPPGTGKSSLINYYVHHFSKNVMVTYDSKVYMNDEFYLDFINSTNKDCLLLEDADEILRQKETRSEVLSKILNVGDGVFDSFKKKIIITGNLDNIGQVDSALSRKGRCFHILTSRDLTPNEANNLASLEGRESNFTKPVSLAEFYNGEDSNKVHKFKVGF